MTCSDRNGTPITVTGNSGTSGFVLVDGANNALQFATINPTGNGSGNLQYAVQFASGVDAPIFGGLSGSSNIKLQDLTTSVSGSGPSGTAVALTVNDTNNTTYSGTLTGAGSLTKSGTGTLVLSASGSTFSGGVTLNGGTLTIGATTTGSAGSVTAGSLGTGTVTLAGGTLNSNTSLNYTNPLNNALNVTGSVSVGGGTNFGLGGAITGAGTISTGNAGSVGSSTYFSGNMSGFTGTFSFTTYSQNNIRFGAQNLNGATLDAHQAAFVLTQGSGSARNVAIDDNSNTTTLEMGSLSGNGVLEGSFNGTTQSAANADIYAIGYLGTSTTFSGVLSDSTGGNQANFNILKVGIGSLTLSGGSSQYTGLTTIENGALIAGATVNASGNGPFGSATSAIALGDATDLTAGDSPQLLIGGAYTMARNITVGSSIAANNSTYTIGGSADNNATFSGNIAMNQSLVVSQVTDAGANALTISGVISTNNGTTPTVTFAGPGNISVTGTNTYSGATVVSGGTTTLSGSGSINSSGSITINGTGAKLIQSSSVAVSPTITVTQGTLAGSTTVGVVRVTAGTGGIVSNGTGNGNTSTTHRRLAEFPRRAARLLSILPVARLRPRMGLWTAAP